MSNIPSRILKNTLGEDISNSLEKEQFIELINKRLESLINSENVKYFEYPSEFKDRLYHGNEYAYLLMMYSSTETPDISSCSIIHQQSWFFVLKSRFFYSKLFREEEFRNIISTIPRCDFEAKLQDNDSKSVYVNNFHELSFCKLEEGNQSYFVAIENNSPVLILHENK